MYLFLGTANAMPLSVGVADHSLFPLCRLMQVCFKGVFISKGGATIGSGEGHASPSLKGGGSGGQEIVTGLRYSSKWKMLTSAHLKEKIAKVPKYILWFS